MTQKRYTANFLIMLILCHYFFLSLFWVIVLSSLCPFSQLFPSCKRLQSLFGSILLAIVELAKILVSLVMSSYPGFCTTMSMKIVIELLMAKATYYSCSYNSLVTFLLLNTAIYSYQSFGNSLPSFLRGKNGTKTIYNTKICIL